MRFAFGKNWQSFLSVIDEARISEAQYAIAQSLNRPDMRGLRVLDIGSGSGLSSLAMHRLGAEVLSFDYDIDSVACTEQLRQKHAASDPAWAVRQGSVLDSDFMNNLGQFDLVYAWGVLHHTGSMWDAIHLAQQRVAPGGLLLVALYNDQGWRSKIWWHIKRIYCSSRVGRWMVTGTFYPLFALYTFILDIRNFAPLGSHILNYSSHRGMSIMHDWRDWLGGFPFETAAPKEVIHKLNCVGFDLISQNLTKGWGCNEFILVRRGEIHGL